MLELIKNHIRQINNSYNYLIHNSIIKYIIKITVFSLIFILPCLLQAGNSKSKLIRMKFGTIVPDNSPVVDEWAKPHKKSIEVCSQNRIRVKIFAGGILGDENTMVQKIKNGSLHMYAGTFGSLATEIPNLIVFGLPFLFNNNEEIDYLFKQIMPKELPLLVNNNEFILIGIGDVGWRSMFTKSIINDITDLQNMRIRCQQTPLHLDIWKSLGVIPRPIGATETLTALQGNFIDGFDQSLTFAYASSWYSQTKYLTLTKHLYIPGMVVLSSKFYNKLPEDLKPCIYKKIKNLNVLMRNQVVKMRKLSASLIPIFKQAGLNVRHIQQDQIEKIKTATKPVWTSLKNRLDSKGKKFLNKIIELLSAYRKDN